MITPNSRRRSGNLFLGPRPARLALPPLAPPARPAFDAFGLPRMEAAVRLTSGGKGLLLAPAKARPALDPHGIPWGQNAMASRIVYTDADACCDDCAKGSCGCGGACTGACRPGQSGCGGDVSASTIVVDGTLLDPFGGSAPGYDPGNNLPNPPTVDKVDRPPPGGGGGIDLDFPPMCNRTDFIHITEDEFYGRCCYDWLEQQGVPVDGWTETKNYCRHLRPDNGECVRDCEGLSVGDSSSYRQNYQLEWQEPWVPGLADVELVLNDAFKFLIENQDLAEWVTCWAGKLYRGRPIQSCVRSHLNGVVVFEVVQGRQGSELSTVDGRGMPIKLFIEHPSWAKWEKDVLTAGGVVRSCSASTAAAKILHELVHVCGFDSDEEGHGQQIPGRGPECRSCGGVAYAVNNAFRWALQRRYPCLAGAWNCNPFVDDRLWMWTGSSELRGRGEVPDCCTA